MKTLKNAFVILVLSFLAFSVTACNLNINTSKIKGNGNVITQDRTISENFNKISVSHGIDVKVKQDDTKSIKVEIDENLQENIAIYVENNTLRIKANESYSSTKGATVYVTNPDILALTSSSGSGIETENTIKTVYLEIKSSSGSKIEASVEADELIAESSSGSKIELEGKALKLDVSSSSGSSIDAEDLKVNEVSAQSSSGSSIKTYPIEKLNAKASSGSSIRYKNSPTELIIKESSGGSIRK